MADPALLARALSADQSANYNTPLEPAQEAAFQQWLAGTGRAGDLADYDLRGAWKANAQAAGNGHLPDDWKKPNHPTFSNESIYHGPYTPGGQWAQLPGGKWSFTAGPQNLKYQSPADLQAYFQRVEPGNLLVIPDQAPAPSGLVALGATQLPASAPR